MFLIPVTDRLMRREEKRSDSETEINALGQLAKHINTPVNGRIYKPVWLL